MPTSATGSRETRNPFVTPAKAGVPLFLVKRSGTPDQVWGDDGSPRPLAHQGFTLIELMVVLAILGLASAVVVFALPSSNAAVRQDAERFAARTTAARDLAIVSARPVRLVVTSAGYGFTERRGGAWAVVPAKAMQDARWAPGTKVAGQTSVTFDPTGMVSAPLVVALMHGDVQARVEVDGNGVAHVAP